MCTLTPGYHLGGVLLQGSIHPHTPNACQLLLCYCCPLAALHTEGLACPRHARKADLITTKPLLQMRKLKLPKAVYLILEPCS